MKFFTERRFFFIRDYIKANNLRNVCTIMSNFVLNALLINLVTVGLGLKTFKAIRSCYGKAGCSYNNPDGIQKLADILDDLANVIPDCHRVNLCAFLCLSDKDCLGFNYLKDIDSCYFYHFYPNVIYYKKDCVYFEESFAILISTKNDSSNNVI